MSEFQPYNYEATSLARSARIRAKRDLNTWLFASLGLSLVPYLIISLAYRASHAVQHHYSFPSRGMLFGKGDLLLIVLSVTGATIAELLLFPSHLTTRGKRLVLATTGLIALAAGSVFTYIAAHMMEGGSPGVDGNFVANLSIATLLVVVTTQVITVLTRPIEI
jgi:hypothetical protein